MRVRQGQLLDTARHVQAFLDDNAALIGPTIASSRRNLDDVVSQLTTMAVTQTAARSRARAPPRGRNPAHVAAHQLHEAHRRRRQAAVG